MSTLRSLSEIIPLKKYHPATGEYIEEFPTTLPSEVPVLIARARAAQINWGQTPIEERAAAIRKLGQVIADNALEIAQAISQQTGKPVIEALFHEMIGAANLARYFGLNAKRILKPTSITISIFKHRKSWVHYVPRGVVGVIGPWNFPFTLMFGDVAMALCAGNAVVLKASEHTPGMGVEIKRWVERAGIDPELLQIATGAGDVGAAVVGGGVNMVHFTGSVATGRKIAAACGERLIPCVLELGGKDAALVLEDADIEHAAQAIVWGGFLNSGQACVAIERVYAVGETYNKLLDRMVALTKTLRQGNGSTEDVEVGPMITGAQLQIVKHQLADAKSRGAVIHTGGEIKEDRFVEPTIVTSVNDDMLLMTEETFGPVIPVVAVSSVEEAIAKANASSYGLSAYVFTRNPTRAREVARQLQAGTVVVNDGPLTHGMPELPWGGVKASGVGHTHSDDGLRHMCEMRHVNEGRLPAFTNPWYFPYKRDMAKPLAQVIAAVFGGSGWLTRSRGLIEGGSRFWRIWRR